MSHKKQPQGIDTQGKIPFLRKMAYGSGGAAECIMANLILVLALPIFNLGLGIDAKLIGLALLIQKFWDAITDPVMGNISDNSRLRWGRRKPFILIGAILTGIFCMVMWMPPAGLSDTGLIVFFILVTICYYTSYTVFFVPFNALGFEMTSNYDERTKIMGYKTMFMNFANMAFLRREMVPILERGKAPEEARDNLQGTTYKSLSPQSFAELCETRRSLRLCVDVF